MSRRRSTESRQIGPSSPVVTFGNCVRAVLSLVIALTIATEIPARDFYVNNEFGDDRNDGGSADFASGTGPFRSIQRAVKAAQKGDRIIVAKTAEPYRESITLQGGNNSGTSLTDFQIEGNGAVLDGSTPITAAWEHVEENLFRVKLDRIKFQILFNESIPADKVLIDDPADLLKLKPLQYAIFDKQVYFMTEKDRLPDSYDLSCCGKKVGITLYQTQYVAIFDLTIQGFQLDGINCHDLALHSKVFGTTLRGNGRSGISVGGASRLLVGSCVIGNNGKSQIRVEGQSRTTVQQSDLVKNENAMRIEIVKGHISVDEKAIEESLK